VLRSICAQVAIATSAFLVAGLCLVPPIWLVTSWSWPSSKQLSQS